MLKGEKIFQKVSSIVVVTYVKLIPKFGYDQINISSRKVLFKNMSNLSKFDGHNKTQQNEMLLLSSLLVQYLPET